MAPGEEYDDERYLVLTLVRDWHDFLEHSRGPYLAELRDTFIFYLDDKTRKIQSTHLLRHLDQLIATGRVERVEVEGKRPSYIPTTAGRRAVILYLKRRSREKAHRHMPEPVDTRSSNV